MQFVDLARQQQRIRDAIEANIRAVLDHGQYIMGREVDQLEEELREYVGVRHAISCSSGTDALLLALMAYGVKPGDAVFTTPFTFIATAEVIALLGAVPVFVDIEAQTFNIDPEKLAAAIAAVADGGGHPLPRHSGAKLVPRGIVAVDLFGVPADYEAINNIAKQHNLFVIEDAAQSFGAVRGGRRACGLAEVGCTSFFPAKPLGCYGDGGMCFTNDDRLAEVMRSLRIHGKGGHQYDNIRVGINGRLDTLQAAVLLAKLKVFPEEVTLRREVAARYSRLLSDHPGLRLPTSPEEVRSVWAQYTLLAPGAARAVLQERMAAAGVPSAVYYPKPLHLQEAFRYLGYRQGDFPESEKCAASVLSLPMHPYLTAEEQERIARILS